MLAQLVLSVIVKIIFLWKLEDLIGFEFFLDHLLKHHVMLEFLLELHQDLKTLPLVLGFSEDLQVLLWLHRFKFLLEIIVLLLAENLLKQLLPIFHLGLGK